ncbi:MAG TPA: hypothetical protein VEU77_09005 [Candidatus Acidoferrales bacterium]|nr:hypothetical protein [Candidatus Acidoferrales bacterium]
MTGLPRLLYGTTPPRFGTPSNAVVDAAEKLVARLRALPLDGVVVYDIQDETGRVETPRPFPFVRTVDPRAYATLLEELSGRSTITYKSLGDLSETAWSAWLSDTADRYGTRYLSVVGRPTSRIHYAMPLLRAIRLAADHPAGFIVGGVAIAERHIEGRSEAARLLAKGTAGCRFFVSQAVYHSTPTIELLRDYLAVCRDAGAEPRPVVLTFAPCGRPKTLAFLRWLGVNVAPATEELILRSTSPLTKSIEVCRDNLQRILDQPYRAALSLGINVESLSIYRDEIDASIELFHTLNETIAAD